MLRRFAEAALILIAHEELRRALLENNLPVTDWVVNHHELQPNIVRDRRFLGASRGARNAEVIRSMAFPITCRHGDMHMSEMRKGV